MMEFYMANFAYIIDIVDIINKIACSSLEFECFNFIIYHTLYTFTFWLLNALFRIWAALILYTAVGL